MYFMQEKNVNMDEKEGLVVESGIKPRLLILQVKALAQISN